MSETMLRTRPRLEQQETILYQALDSFGVVLYVGITNNYKRRMIEHRCNSEWAALVAEYTTCTYPNRTQAKCEESRLISELDPRFNIAETPRHSERIINATRNRNLRAKGPDFVAGPPKSENVTTRLLCEDLRLDLEDVAAVLVHLAEMGDMEMAIEDWRIKIMRRYCSQIEKLASLAFDLFPENAMEHWYDSKCVAA